MTFAFQHHHGAMLLKYSGISFISGAVNHGFFSGERSLWTAAIGICLFVVGALLEHRLTDSEMEPEQKSLLNTLALGALLSIGLGFFTGGLQHFPDSPDRSAWVVPLGFFVSVAALALNTSHAWRRSSTAYVLALGTLISAGSYGAWQWLVAHPQWAMHEDSHMHSSDNQNHDPNEFALNAWVVTRSVEVRMDDQMRFTPSRIDVQAGEVIRFVVHNDGNATHEMVLGDDAEIQAHAKAMQQGEGHGSNHSHSTAAALTLAGRQSGELVVRFDQVRTLQIVCLIPGHYSAGMRGTLNVLPTLPKTNAHDHSQHKH